MNRLCLTGLLILIFQESLSALTLSSPLPCEARPVQKNLIKTFNSRDYAIDALRVKSAREACLVEKHEFTNGYLVLGCTFINGQHKDLYFSPEFMTLQSREETLILELDSNTTLSFKDVTSKKTFIKLIESIVTLYYTTKEETKNSFNAFDPDNPFTSTLKILQNITTIAPKQDRVVKNPDQIIFDFQKNFNVYSESFTCPDYLKDPDADIDQFAHDFFDTANESLSNLESFSLRNLTDIVKVISFHCLSDKNLLNRMTRFLSPDNHILNSWMIKKDILLSDSLIENFRHITSGEAVLTGLRNENDLLYLSEIRQNLTDHKWPGQSPECYCHGRSPGEQARIRVFFYFLKLKTLPGFGEPFIHTITNEESGPDLQKSALDFDHYGRFAQAGSSMKDYLKLEKKIQTSGKDMVVSRYDQLVSHALWSVNLREYFKDVLEDLDEVPGADFSGLSVLLNLDETMEL